ncbi:MAG TPA: hypothetical protein VIY73_26260 [Polyangiaceae bacterium]
MRRVLSLFPCVLVVAASQAAASAGCTGTGDGACALTMAPYDVAAGCRGAPESVGGICYGNVAQGKGLYMLCAVNGAGDVFALQAASDQQFHAPGWSFGPKNSAGPMVHLPVVPDSYEGACEQVATYPTVAAIPVCSSAGEPSEQ